MLLPVAVVVDDSVNHVARPIDIGLVAHHRDVVLAVLVALLVCGGLPRKEREGRREYTLDFGHFVCRTVVERYQMCWRLDGNRANRGICVCNIYIFHYLDSQNFEKLEPKSQRCRSHHIFKKNSISS